MTGNSVLTGANGLTDRLAVVVAGFLYRWVVPRMGPRGSGRLAHLPWFRSRRVRARFDGVDLVVPAFDPFWGQFFYRGVPYEPEVGAAMRLLGAVGPATFLDCGANYGYWSVQAAAGRFGDHKVVAVEASEGTHCLLAENLGTRAEAVHAAVSDRVGTVSFDDTLPHQARMIAPDGKIRIPATTIDSLAGDAKRLLVKLDVEGAEPAALQGASGSLARADVAFLYEDHAKDRDCVATVAMQSAGLSVFHLDADTHITAIASLQQVLDRKPDRSVGYNFVAVTPGGDYEAALRTTSASRCLRPSGRPTQGDL